MNKNNKIKFVIILFLFLIFFLSTKIFGDVYSLCEFNNQSLKNYSNFAEIKILAKNGITTGSIVSRFPIYSNNSIIGYVYDNKESCDDVSDDGLYCGIIQAKDIVDNQILLKYSSIAEEKINISIVNDTFADYSISCSQDQEYAICRINSKDKFILAKDKNKTIVTSFRDLQGYLRNYELYQYTDLCGKRKINLEILFPDYISPSKPKISCDILSDNRVLISWSNSSDNFGVKKYELLGCGFSVNLSDDKKVTEYGVKKAGCNFEKIAEFKNDQVYEFEGKCDNCELYYQVKVYDYFNNSEVSDICKTYTDSTKPKLEIYFQHPEKILILYGDPVFLYYDKKYQFKNGLVLNYSSKIDSIYAYDAFGNFEKLAINIQNETPTVIFYNGKPNLNIVYSNNEVFSKDLKEDRNGKYFYYVKGNHVSKFVNYLNEGFSIKNSFLFLKKDLNYSVDGNYKLFETEDEFVIVFKSINLTLNYENQQYIYSFVSDDDLFSLINALSITEVINKTTLFEIINQSISYDYYLSEDLTIKQKPKPLSEVIESKIINESKSGLNLITGWAVKSGELLKQIAVPLLFALIFGLILIFIFMIFLLDYFRAGLFKKEKISFKKPKNVLGSFKRKGSKEVLPEEILKKIEEKRKMQNVNEEVKQKFINQAVEEDKKIVQKQLERKRWRFMR
ncbi:MAG: hypothetical protein QXS41_01845 [Candidatus Woesearchaeota archaeon]